VAARRGRGRAAGLTDRREAATRWAAVLTACAAGVAVALNVGKVPVALSLLREEFGLTLLQAGWVSSMLTTVAVLSAALFGLAVGHVGALRMAVVGLAVSMLASLATLGAASAQALLWLRFIEGAGFIAVAVSCPALVSAAAAPADRRFAIGLWATYMPLGASIAMAAAPLLLAAGGWRLLWEVTAAALALAAAALLTQRRYYRSAEPATPPGAPAPAPAPDAGVTALLRRPLPWVLAGCFGVWATQHFALIIWMPTYLMEQRASSAGAAALLTALMLLACVPGNVVGGALVQRGVPRGALIAAAHVTTGLAGWACIGEGLPDALRYAASLLLSFSGGLIPAAVMSSSALVARTPQQIATLQGLFMHGSQLGQFAGTPLIAAAVAVQGHWSAALQITLPAALAGALLGLGAWRLERRPMRLA